MTATTSSRASSSELKPLLLNNGTTTTTNKQHTTTTMTKVVTPMTINNVNKKPPPQSHPNDEQHDIMKKSNHRDEKNSNVILIIIYGLINTIMTVPCMYGYASVIFNNPAYAPHMNALSKLTLFSSVIHQIAFGIFSSLPFSIGQVQDAGLIFLSVMSDDIARRIQQNSSSKEEEDVEIVSTAVVLLGLGTSLLGALLYLMGRLRMADAVSYLPLPVIGGYLAFIGYFCLAAGVGMCVDESLVTLSDWYRLFVYCDEDEDVGEESVCARHWRLAVPGIVAGMMMTIVSRQSTSDMSLPLVMVIIPATFYLLIYLLPSYGGMEQARRDGWVGERSDTVGVRDVLGLVTWSAVRWDCVRDVWGTWAGMVFVVSFSSCLDVAAIGTDMGEALDTNNELRTVGISNVFSGLFGGFTGSYIFSQTIFTYRSGVWTRWIGVIVAISELGVFLMSTNVLEVTPLFFLGSTLIFIGFDLVYEWIIEVRHKLLLSEYLILLFTFIAIQIFGIQSGIIIGIAVAIMDYVISTSRITPSLLKTTKKRSRAVWNQYEWKILQRVGYDNVHPKIVSFELRGTVFFGSSLHLLTMILERVGLNSNLADQPEEIDRLRSAMASPGHVKSKFASPRHVGNRLISPYSHRLRGHCDSDDDDINNGRKLNRGGRQRSSSLGSYNSIDHTTITTAQSSSTVVSPPTLSPISPPLTRPRPIIIPPDFIVLDLHDTTNLDASAARGCFLQLSKMCGKKRIVVCAGGANRRVRWMLQSHEVVYDEEEEKVVKARLLGYGGKDEEQGQHSSSRGEKEKKEEEEEESKMLVFETVDEALEFCESALLEKIESNLMTTSSSPTVSTTASLMMMPVVGSDGDASTKGRRMKTMKRNISNGSLSARALEIHSSAHEEKMNASTMTTSLSSIFNQYIKMEAEELLLIENVLQDHDKADHTAFYDTITLSSAGVIFEQGTWCDSFYIILQGSVIVSMDDGEMRNDTMSFDEHQHHQQHHHNHHHHHHNHEQHHRSKILPLGSIFGYCDFVLEQKYMFAARAFENEIFGYCDFVLEQKYMFAARAFENETIVARFCRKDLDRLKEKSLETLRIVERVLLTVSVRELNNVNGP